MVKRGASVPPEVPLPSEIDQETNFSAASKSRASPPTSAERMWSMLS
jgi:hypothetical protein